MAGGGLAGGRSSGAAPLACGWLLRFFLLEGDARYAALAPASRPARRAPQRRWVPALTPAPSAWASPRKQEEPQRVDAGQGSGPRAASTREASPAMRSLPQRPEPRHTARPVKDRSSYPGSAATHEGRGGTLPPHGPTATASASSGTRVRRLSPGTYKAGDRGPPAPRPAWRGIQPSLAARRRWPSSSCAPRGRALTHESCGSTVRSRARRENAHRGTTAGVAKPLPSRSGKRSAEPLEGVWGREESAARAQRSGAGAYRCAPRGAMR